MTAQHPNDRLNRPLRDLRISVTDRCNFRCPYCMPAELFGDDSVFLPRDELLSFEEIVRLAGLFAENGVRKLRVTGGEPLLRKDLTTLIARLAAVEGVEDLAMTTNGMLLPKHARSLRAAGLNRITVSLDALDPRIFSELSGGRGAPEQVLEGIAAAQEAGFERVKLNCVVQRGINESEILPLVEHFRGTPHVLRFIEFMDVGTRNGWELDRVVPARELLAMIDAAHPIEPLAPTVDGEVARRWRFVDGAGEVGVITSVTQPFCGSCNRARLSTDGRLVTCLFASSGVDLRGPLRSGASDQALRDLIASRWESREDRYSEQRTSATDPERYEMFRLGG